MFFIQDEIKLRHFQNTGEQRWDFIGKTKQLASYKTETLGFHQNKTLIKKKKNQRMYERNEPKCTMLADLQFSILLASQGQKCELV